MTDAPDIASVASLIGDRIRAQMLQGLMTGRAHTATELAATTGITKSTASSHLGKLLDARLIRVAAQGRHRYFRLADSGVADLLERLTTVTERGWARRAKSSRTLLFTAAGERAFRRQFPLC